jgi:hypothetical protein
MPIEHPDHGGRVRLELREHDAQGALYTVTLFTADALWQSTARVSIDGASAPACARFEGAAGQPPAWLVRYAGSMLAVLQRDHKQAPSARWPRRVLRWRAERG